jgi:hypothetical protein
MVTAQARSMHLGHFGARRRGVDEPEPKVKARARSISGTARSRQAVRCRHRHRHQRGDRVHRPVGLRQVDLPALHQPHERHHPDLLGSRATSGSMARTSTTSRSTRCSCAPRSAWSSRSPTRSPSRSTTTSPTRRVSTASPPTRRSSTRSSRAALKGAGAVEGGRRPSRPAGHRAFRRSAAAPVHRARHGRQPRGDL